MTFTNGTAIGAIAFAVWALGASILGEPPFLRVVEMRAVQGGEYVYVKRVISGPDGIADWRVTVVAKTDTAPSCATIPGPNLHEGWSDYQTNEAYERTVPLDKWVGDPGCFERLKPGPHTEYVTWTPRDGRDPVTHKRTFTK